MIDVDSDAQLRIVSNLCWKNEGSHPPDDTLLADFGFHFVTIPADPLLSFIFILVQRTSIANSSLLVCNGKPVVVV